MTAATGIIKLLLGAGIVVKLVLVILLLLSIMSWAVIADRWRFFQRADQQSAKFLRSFRSQRDLRQLHREMTGLTGSPSANVFREVFGKFSGGFSVSEERTPDSVSDQQTLVDTIYSELSRASHAELAKCEDRLSTLATTATVSPFFGLFGTVWGIMNSFLSISAQGSTSIVVVAPGIAEALITTAAGLAVAIPSVMAYNYFLNRTRLVGLELEDVATSLLNVVQTRGRSEKV